MEEEKRFDFLEGEWDAFSQFPKENGSKTEGQGTLKATKVLGGCVSMEFYDGPLEDKMIQGLGLRAYNRETREWEHTWTDSANPGYFYVWRGIFQGDKIDLFSEWKDESGDLIKSRLTWSEISDRSAHWESWRSKDGGKNWKKYWIIDFKKKA